MAPDYARWALVDCLTVYQAACLIAETEPTTPLLSSPLVDAIYDELLPYARRLNLEYELRNDITREIPLSDGDLKFTRDELLDYFTRKIYLWDKIDHKPTIPRFLCSPEPTTNDCENNENKFGTDNTLSKDKTKPETYLRIIRALSNLIRQDTDDNGVPLCKLPGQKGKFPSQNELIAHLLDRNPLESGIKDRTLKGVYSKANKLQDVSLTAEDLDYVFSEIKDLGSD